MGAHYVGKSEYMGVETDEFAIDIGSNENSKECYCRDEDSCPKKGLQLINLDNYFCKFPTGFVFSPLYFTYL